MSTLDFNILSALIWLPVLGGVAVLALGGDERAPLVRKLSLGIALAVFLLSLPLYLAFDTGTAAMQFVERGEWVPAFNIYYHLGVDGISMPLILLTTFLTIIVVISAWRVIQVKIAQYMAAFLVMEGVMIGVFSALDSILFYVFWEAMLVPMFLIIGIWGGPNRVYATIKFFLFTLLGSLLMLVAFLYMYNQTGSFGVLDFQQARIPFTPQLWLFFAFFSAFAVKVPMVPVHTWLPDAHVEAPTGGSVILAAVMLKMGAYGFVRFNLPMLPDASQALAGLMIALALIAVIYISLVALVQSDMKKLIAYSSVAHMGFVILGFFIFNARGIEGALVQMISHGFISGALFLCIGVMYDRLHTRRIADYGGVANRMPVFAAFMMLFSMANVGLPGTSGFVGEFLVILGAFEVNPWYAILVATILFLGAAYTLWLYKRVLFGAITNPEVETMTDATPREVLFLSLLAIAVLALGVWPDPLLDVMHASVEHLINQATATKL